MNWILLALLSPIFFAIGALFDKYLIDKRFKDPFTFLISSRILIIPLPIIILALNGFKWIGIIQFLLLFFAGILSYLYLLPYLKALKKEEASRVTPLFQMIPVFSLGLSYFLLNEQLNNVQLVGFILILLGVFIVSVERFDGKIFKPRQALWLMVASCLIYSFTIIFFKFVAVGNDFWFAYAYMLLGEIIAAMVFSFKNKSIFKLRRLPLSTFILSLISYSTALFGRLAGFYALLFLPVAIVTDIGAIQPVFVLIFAVFISKIYPKIIEEDLSLKNLAHKSIGLAPILFGAILVNWG